jgi:ATP citrate (pro-S)-lyase
LAHAGEYFIHVSLLVFKLCYYSYSLSRLPYFIPPPPPTYHLFSPSLLQTKLVVKPDCLFGKRGKHDLVGLNLDYVEAEAFIKARMNKIVDMDGIVGRIDCFIIEPFVPHDAEYYLCLQTERTGIKLSFSDHGGMDIEENWDKVKSVEIPTGATPDAARLAPLLSTLQLEIRPGIEKFIQATFAVFEDLDFTLIEMNPFTLDSAGAPFPLDCRGEVDDTASFKSAKKWGDIEFPLPFGRTMSAQEAYVHSLDEQTGASLKLTILNPKGRVWTMVAGGGASVIYADTVGDLGLANELGNYAEYSGGPNTQETYLFARTLLDCATANPDGRGRALIIGGGIANFTDVAATFKGIIQAIRERADAIKAAKMRLFVRRGGPNYKVGLKMMEALGNELQIPIEVFGPEASMTGICKLGIEYVKSFDTNGGGN